MTTTTNPAEQLRTAAQTIRETAKNTTPGRWQVGNGEVIGLNIEQHTKEGFSYGAQIARVLKNHERQEENYDDLPLGSTGGDAAWIALVHPGLTEPLARWLDDTATAFDDDMELHEGDHWHTGSLCGGKYGENCLCWTWPLAVAAAINGTTPA